MGKRDDLYSVDPSPFPVHFPRMSSLGLLEIDFEGHWLRLEANWLGRVRLLVDRRCVAQKLKWFKSSDLPIVSAQLDDGTLVEGYAKTDSNGSRIRFAIAVDGRTVART